MADFIVNHIYLLLAIFVGMVAVVLFIQREKVKIDREFLAPKLTVNRPLTLRLYDSKDEQELNARINGFRERSNLSRLTSDPLLKEMAIEHLAEMVEVGCATPYNDEYDIEELPTTKIYGIVSDKKKTICSTFVGFEHNKQSLEKVMLPDVNRVGSAIQLHNGNYFTVTLFATFNPALDLP